MHTLLGELGYNLKPIPIGGDNQGSIFIASNPVTKKRSKNIDIHYHCYVRIRLDPDVPREDEKTSPADSYRLSTTERVPERTKSRTEERQDGRSRAGGSERSEEPQRDTREKKVILVLR